MSHCPSSKTREYLISSYRICQHGKTIYSFGNSREQISSFHQTYNQCTWSIFPSLTKADTLQFMFNGDVRPAHPRTINFKFPMRARGAWDFMCLIYDWFGGFRPLGILRVPRLDSLRWRRQLFAQHRELLTVTSTGVLRCSTAHHLGPCRLRFHLTQTF